MNALLKLVFPACFIATAACGGSLSQAGAQVRLMKNDPPPACQELGSVSGYLIGPNYQERLKNKLRNDAAGQGGNYVRLETLTSDGNASGSVFKCTDAPIAASVN